MDHHGHWSFTIIGPMCAHIPSGQREHQPRKWDVDLQHRVKRGRVGRSAMRLWIGLQHRSVSGLLSIVEQWREIYEFLFVKREEER
jgi:hypothetical protein